jgi:hypothetical protein
MVYAVILAADILVIGRPTLGAMYGKFGICTAFLNIEP